GKVAPPLSNPDFAPFVTQIKNQPTKDVYSVFSGADAIGFIKAWNSLGLPAAGYKMYGAGFLTEQDVLKEVKDLANGAITSLFWAVELDNPENKSFVSAYQRQYTLLPDVFAVQAYDGMHALDEALKKIGADTSDPDKVSKALEDVSFKSPRGDFMFDKNTHNPVQDIYIREVKTQNGQTVNTIGVSLVIVDQIGAIWGREVRSLAAPAGLDGSVPLVGGEYPVYRLFVIGFGVLLAAVVSVVHQRTKVGMLIRAGVEDAEMLGALGVNTDRLFAATFAVGAALAGLAGVVAAPVFG